MAAKRKRRKKKNTARLALALALIAAVTVAAVALVSALLRRQKAPWEGGYSVHISEVMTDNVGAPRDDGSLADWVEIANTSARPFDLTGYYLSDDAGNGKYRFPAGSAVPAHGYLVVWCSLEEGGDFAPFALKKEGGESVCLMNSNRVVLDEAVTVACAPGQSLIRASDGSLVPCDTPTPGYSNDDAGAAAWRRELASRSAGRLELSEIMSANTLFPAPDGVCYDWVEVHNPTNAPVSLNGWKLSDREDKAKYAFPENGVLQGGEYMVIWCSAEGTGADFAPFALARAGGETVVLTDSTGAVADTVTVPALEKNTSYWRANGAWSVSATPTPGAANDAAAYAAHESAAGWQDAPVYITEIMAHNHGTLTDGDGDFSDWLELANLGDTEVSLAGWFLSDKAEEPREWALPELTLAPGEHRLIFASGKNRTGEELHTSFSLSDGETVYLVTPAGTPLRAQSVDGAEKGDSLALDADGQYRSAAYPTPGEPNTPEGYERFAQGDGRESGLLLWEAAVYDSDGADWVELKNVSGEAIDLSEYYLTDNPDRTDKFQSLSGTLAPGALTAVECSAFSLNAQQDSLYLFRADGTACDWMTLRNIPVPGSYGRQDGENGFFYFTRPTPGAENAQGWRMVAETPAALTAPGVYDDAAGLPVELWGADIRYTTDGSTPTADSAAYTGPIAIDRTTVLRAASFPAGQLPSAALTASYFLGENSSLPIVSLVTDRENLFGARGVYSNHQTAWENGWEREASLEFYEDGGGFAIDCGVKIHGRVSRGQSEKRSLSLKFRGHYGGTLSYDVFGDGAVTEFSTLLLRGSLQDSSAAYIADNLFADMAMDFTDVPAMNYRYVSLFINGEYWGIYSLREHHDEDYFASHYGVDADSVQVYNGFARYPGTFSQLLSYAESHNLSGEAEWRYIQEHLDVAEMIDWLILECWGGDIDVFENVRFYSSPEYEDNRVLYGLVDMDLTMSSTKTLAVGFDYDPAALHWIIPRGLMGNAEFRDMFLKRLGELLQNDLSDAAVLARIETLRAQVEPESARDLARWGFGETLFTNSLNRLTSFATGRAQQMIDGATAYFGLSAEQRAAYFGG